tara:strand:- start:1438 stop:1839 length:402 start_codon:yes stop_codon:yes gene_type:complete
MSEGGSIFQIMIEQHRTLRGHDFMPDPTFLTHIPDLYATEEVPVEEKVVYIHYTIPASMLAFDWWIVELELGTELAFGYACLNGDTQNAEWGYISLPELEEIVMRGSPPALVERDLDFVPKKWSEVKQSWHRG